MADQNQKAECSQEMLEAAMKAAVANGVIARYVDADAYLRNWEGMKTIISAALAAAPAVPAVEALTRYSARGLNSMRAMDDGQWLKLADVQALLATPSTAPLVAAKEQPQPSCDAALRAAPAGQHDAGAAMLSSALNHAREALRFYAEQEHFHMHEPDVWDTVSGEPQNFYEDESHTATVEDGSVAKHALENIAHVERYADLAHPADAGAVAVEQAIPEDWQLVPTTPNEAMMEAAAKADDEGFEAGRSHGASGREIYAAMLAAAPVPPVPAPAEQPSTQVPGVEPGYSDSLADRVFNLPCDYSGPQNVAYHLGHTKACEQAFDLVTAHFAQSIPAGSALGSAPQRSPEDRLTTLTRSDGTPSGVFIQARVSPSSTAAQEGEQGSAQAAQEATSERPTSPMLDIIRTMVFAIDQFAAAGDPNDPAPWALNSPVVLAARRLCYEYGYPTGDFVEAAPANRLDEELATFLAEHTRLNQDGIDSHAMKMVLALNYAALNPVPESDIAEWREQGYVGAEEGAAGEQMGGAQVAKVDHMLKLHLEAAIYHIRNEKYADAKGCVEDVLRRMAAKGEATERKPLTDALSEVHKFLLGEGPLDGMHFGDSDTARPRSHCWWRPALRRAIEQHHGITGGGK
jgi:hypothetical protein